jgi:prepilin-type N-terminal cleavage/methylation domain-containing protein
MRLRGFALSELLVAVAIAGLIISVLTFLNVDYIGLARRVVDIQHPYAMGARAQAGGDLDRCAEPGATLTAIDNQVVAQVDNEASPVLTLGPSDAGTDVVTAGGSAGSTNRPVRVIVEAAPGAGGGSMASLVVGDATVGVIAPRCDLTEVCAYDAANAVCRKAQTNAAGADGANAADGGQALAGHG